MTVLPAITRSEGIFVGGFNPGGGRYGLTENLDSIVSTAAEALRERYGRDVEIRFNSDRLSGGAYLNGLGASVGISAQLYTLTRARQLVDRARTRWGDTDDTFEHQCERWHINPGGPEQQITHHVFCDARFLIGAQLAECGNPDHRYAFPLVADIAAGLAWLQENATVPAP
jgi:hypothetical protein